jgi:hypothetical protein
VTCGACEHTWKVVGNWSVYEREAIESRPCPACSAYTLKSPEPEAAKPTCRRAGPSKLRHSQTIRPVARAV